MRKLGITTVVLVALAATAILAAGAFAGTQKKVAFAAKYAGNATTTIADNVVSISAKGVGTGTPIGKGAITGTGTGDSSQQPCVPFGGTGKLTGTGGTTLTFKVPSNASGCGDEGGHTFAIVGHATVVKGTGKLAKAKGTLKFTGTYSHDDGSFTVKFSGSLTQ
jgi:hypothetical protein